MIFCSLSDLEVEDLVQVVQVVVRDLDQGVLLEVSIPEVQDPVLGVQQEAWDLDLDQEVQLEAEDHDPDHDQGVQQAVELPGQGQGHQQVVPDPDQEVGHQGAGVDRGHEVDQGLVADQDPVVDLDHQEADLVAGPDQEVVPGVSLGLLPVEKAVSLVFVKTIFLQC